MKIDLKYIFNAIILLATQLYITPVFSEEIINIELTKIKQEKSAIETKSKELEVACYKKFAVSNCLNDIKIDRQAALNNLLLRELGIKDQQRAKKTGSVQSRNTKSLPAQSVTQITNDSGDGQSNQYKTAVSEKNIEILKSEDEILDEKKKNEKLRVIAAQNRLNGSNQKMAESQEKARIRAIKHSQVDANTARYKKKIIQANSHKNEAEKSRLAKSSKSKPASSPLPLPTATELAR